MLIVGDGANNNATYDNLTFITSSTTSQLTNKNTANSIVNQHINSNTQTSTDTGEIAEIKINVQEDTDNIFVNEKNMEKSVEKNEDQLMKVNHNPAVTENQKIPITKCLSSRIGTATTSIQTFCTSDLKSATLPSQTTRNTNVQIQKKFLTSTTATKKAATLPTKNAISSKSHLRSPKKHNVRMTSDDGIYEPCRLIPADAHVKLKLYDIPFIDDGNTQKNVRRSFSGGFSQKSIEKDDESYKKRKRSTSINNTSTFLKADTSNFQKLKVDNISPQKLVDAKPLAHYTPSEVKRARICSTKSLSDQNSNQLQSLDMNTTKCESVNNLNHKKKLEYCENVENTDTTDNSMQLVKKSSENCESVTVNIETNFKNCITISKSQHAVTTTSQTQHTVMSSITGNKGPPPKVPPKHLKPKFVISQMDEVTQVTSITKSK